MNNPGAGQAHESHRDASPRRALSVDSRSRWIGVALVFAVAALVYANSLSNGFAYDDVHIVQNNEAVHELSRVAELVTSPYWPGEHGETLGLWRPAATAVYAVQWAVGGGTPFIFHLVNVLLHATVSALVLLLLLRLMPLTPAMAGALLFAVHPVHVEAVANVVGFAELLTAFTMLASCLLYLRSEGRPGWRTVAGISVLFAIGMLTKESAATLPALLVLLDAYRRDLRLLDLPAYLKPRLALFGSIVAVGALVLTARSMVLSGFPTPLPPMGAELLTEIPRVWTVPVLWLHYVRLLFFPMDLSADYSPGVINVAVGWGWQSVLGLGLGLAFLALAWHSWRSGKDTDGRGSDRAVGLGILWFIVAILPASNVLFLTGTLMGERLLYMPSIGFCIAAGWVFHTLLARRRAAVQVGFLAVVLLFSARTLARNPTWASMKSVFQAMVREHPEAGRSQWILGDQLWGESEVDLAFRMYRLALGTLDNHYPLLLEIIRRQIGENRLDSAERLAQMAWEIEPTAPIGPGLLALALVEQGKFSEAIEPAEFALERSGDDPLIQHILARAYRGSGDLESAVEMRKELIAGGRSGSPYHEWYWLAELYLELHDHDAAEEAVLEAERLAETPVNKDEVADLSQRIGDAKSSL